MSDWWPTAAGWSAAAVCLGAAGLTTAGHVAPVRRRLAAVRPPLAGRPRRWSAPARVRIDPAASRPPLVGCATTLAGLLCFGAGGVTGTCGWALVGVVVTLVVARRARVLAAADRSRLAASQAPLAADLFAACVAAGAHPAEAAASVSRVLDGDLARRFGTVAAGLRLGVDPVEAWRPLAAEAATEPLARALGRGCRTGAPLGEVASVLADDLRGARRAVARRATRQAGVRAMAPLGGCFLPAFVLLAVVPMIAGLVSRLPL